MKSRHQIIRTFDSYRGTEPWAHYRLRFLITLALSLFIHALILSLQLGTASFGLPGLALPWLERHAQAWNLTVRLAGAPPRQAPVSTSAPVPQRVPPTASATLPPQPVEPSRVDKSFEVTPPVAALSVQPQVRPSPPLSEADDPAPTARERDTRSPQPEVLLQNDPQVETFKVPPPAPAAPEQQRVADSAAEKDTDELPVAQKTEAVSKQLEEKAQLEAAELARRAALALQKEQEAKRLEETQKLTLKKELEAKEREARQAEELARQAALSLQKEQEAKRLEEARRINALELEALRRAEDAARQLAVERKTALEAQRQAEEGAALQRAREIAERQRSEAEAAARQRLAAEQAASRAAAGASGDRGPADAPLAPGALSGRDLAANALNQLRTPGAVRTDPPRLPAQPSSADNSRRRPVFGVERDVILRMYIDSWRWRIERNGSLNYSPSASWKVRDYPVVTVAIRSDGSLENVIIDRSSGLREIDEAVRRIARLYAPYSAFPPALARDFDVIELRRVWNFDGKLSIHEEVR